MATIEGRLTRDHVRRFLAGAPSDRHEFLMAGSPKGFGIRRSKGKGNKCSFIAECRVGERNDRGVMKAGSKVRRVTLMPASVQGLDEAREEAEATLARMKAGLDVNEHRRVTARSERQKAMTIREAVLLHLEKRSLAASTKRDINRLLLGADERGIQLPASSRAEHLSTVFMSRPVLSIAPSDVVDAINRLKSESNKGKADRYLSAVVETAYGHLDCDRANPVKRANIQVKRVQRDTHMTIGDAGVLYSRLEAQGTVQARCAQLILLTGLRISEALSLRWEDVETRVFKVRETKNSTHHVLPMTKPVRTLLEQTGTGVRHGNGWVFASNRGKTGHYTTIRQSLDIAAGDDHWLQNQYGDEIMGVPTPHDLRRTVATGMALLGVSKERVAMALNHRSTDITMMYIQSTAQQKVEALTLWQETLLDYAEHGG